MSEFPPEATFRYHRRGEVLRVEHTGLTNHELRTILIGFWLSLDEPDRIDHVAELQHYLEPGAEPPAISVQIAEGLKTARESGYV